MPFRKKSIVGCLLGVAIGDSLGLPLENISRERIPRLFPPPLRQRFLLGGGMVSDETEHAAFTGLALLQCREDPDIFLRYLARYLRFWLLSLPGGVGFATLRACFKLLIGISPANSGVVSAGNGPAMRAPVLGVALGERPDLLAAFVKASTRITHVDSAAEAGALVVALSAHLAADWDVKPLTVHQVIQTLTSSIETLSSEMAQRIERAGKSAEQGEPTAKFADSIGCSHGISGWILHTAPCVIHAWLRYPLDFEGGIAEILACGGDSDTTGAILGGIIGAAVGPDGIPGAWRQGIRDWPWNEQSLTDLGLRLADLPAKDAPNPEQQKVPTIFWPLVFMRNLGFLAVVLAHGFRRIFPPY